ncbi:MAG: TetR/AcrR family transcriptional regulator [Deltaproteobacteria bacterium]|nr:TetR/AcrR family transcriptional regulator [Deltaproteobacteria bacterium]
MAPKIVDKDEKRMEIAHSAIEVFARQGFDRSKMDDVAREAGVGKGTLYEYYADKEALLQGAFDLLIATFMQQLKSEVRHDTPPLETLRAIAHGTIEAMEHAGPVYKFFIEYMLYASRHPEATTALAELLENYRLLVRGLFERGIADGTLRADLDARSAAAAFAAWFDGAIFHWIVLPDGPSLREMADQFIELMLHGMLAKPQGGGR